MWSISDQLGIATRSPAELVATLKSDSRRTVIVLPDLHDDTAVELVGDLAALPHLKLIVESRTGSAAHHRLTGSGCAELDLDLEQWRDQARFTDWQVSLPAPRRSAPAIDHSTMDLADPETVCNADPWLVTAAFEGEHHQHGGLRNAWARAGQSLLHDQSPGSRALSLLSFLGDGADPRTAPALTQIAASEPWQVAWSRVRGDITPPWPGPVTTMTKAQGRLADAVLIADHTGTIRAIKTGDATARGRLPQTETQPISLSMTQDGTLFTLDGSGRVRMDNTWTTRARPAGLADLLEDIPTAGDRLISALHDHTGTAIAWGTGHDTGLVALGDTSGTVHIVGDVTSSAELHNGPVRDLAVLRLPLDEETSAPIVYSGGADGTVRAWAPGHPAMPEPVMARDCPVVSMDAALSPDGPVLAVAWTDGTVTWMACNTGEELRFRPGPPVRAIAMTAPDRLVIGMDEAVICMKVRTPAARGDATTP
ncbi:WD40 repeat domain-containing protein [Streptomyces yangpuensis]